MPNTSIVADPMSTIKGLDFLLATSKYASPVTDTLRSLPIKAVGYVIELSAFNHIRDPSERVMAITWLPLGLAKGFLGSVRL